MLLKNWILLLFVLGLISSCTKDPVIKPEIEPPTPIDTTKVVMPKPKDSLFERRSFSFVIHEHFVDETVDQQLFLGSLWSLKDTTKSLHLENIQSMAKKFPIYVMANSAKEEMGHFFPSYTSILNYANLFKNTDLSGSIEMGSRDFSDYAEIQLYIPLNKDIEKVLNLVKHGDSTTVQKTHSTFRHTLVRRLTLDTDQVDYFSNYQESDLNNLKKLGYSPYFIISVNYGYQLVIAAESDFTRPDMNRAIDKLLEGNPLDNIDEQVLNTTKLLVYYRDGSKDTFIRHAINLQEIKSTLSTLSHRIKSNFDNFTYPLSYLAMHITTGEILGYTNTFDLQVKKTSK
ncbi:MAG: hypothetical protein ACN6ON_12890 [Sphingobacterium sp.]